jgi:hypothetical protein
MFFLMTFLYYKCRIHKRFCPHSVSRTLFMHISVPNPNLASESVPTQTIIISHQIMVDISTPHICLNESTSNSSKLYFDDHNMTIDHQYVEFATRWS